MKKNVISDAVNLATNILNSLSPNREWGIANIALNKADEFLLKNYPTISPSFGYSQNETPSFMEASGIIEGKTKGWWYIDISKQNSQWDRMKPQEITLDDGIESVAQEKGYIKNNEIIMYYARGNDWGPSKHGQMAILVNRNNLEKFIGWYNETTPQFDTDTGIFKFRGASVTIKGQKSINRFKLLFDNLGGFVTKKQFYEVDGKKDYDVINKKTNITRLHDRLEKGFQNLKRIIESDSMLNKSVIMIQKNGFGMFVNKNAEL